MPLRLLIDFQGIIDRLDYIKELGCNAIWMNPCFASPFGDAGYDVSENHRFHLRWYTEKTAHKSHRKLHLSTTLPYFLLLDCYTVNFVF